MKKKIFSLSVILMSCLLVGAVHTAHADEVASSTLENSSGEIITSASELPKVDAYKAVVQIKTLILTADYQIQHYGQGSGVVIDGEGIVLTNYHVVIKENEFDNSKDSVGYQVCFPEDIAKAPDCSYTAKLIAADKDSDMALLKIEKIPGLSTLEEFSYLELNQTDATELNDEVIAMGYPAIGGETITITKGIMSGKNDKYNAKWLKTDAIISFGSSGGAAIDKEGKVIGITSAAHSDLLGTLGYIISSESIYNWVNANKNKSPQEESLSAKITEFTKKEKSLETGNKFESSSPAFNMTKEEGWDFNYVGENLLQIYRAGNDDAGIINISLKKYPYLTSLDDIIPAVKKNFDDVALLAMVSITKESQININGNKGKEITISSMGETQRMAIFPVQEYLIKIAYDYGKSDQDKENIDKMINSFKTTTPDSSLSENTNYSNTDPIFVFKMPAGWSILKKNNKQAPIEFGNKSILNAFGSVLIAKTDEDTKDFDNDGYFNYLLQKIKAVNQMGVMLDLEVDILQESTDYKLNNEITNAIMIESYTKSISTGEVLSYSAEYIKKFGDKFVGITLEVYTSDQEEFDNAAAKFKEMMRSSFSLTGNIVVENGQSQDGTSPEAQPNETAPRDQVLTVKDKKMYTRLRGNILIKVESKGEAYYVNPMTETSHYLGRPADAFRVMREQGIGITNNNLEKISIGVGNLSGLDSDQDGLSDAFEDAIGTDKNKKDTDGDGYDDKNELENDYNLKGAGKSNADINLGAKHKGKIFLQIEGKGEAWYVNPTNSKRYFLGRPKDAFEIMRGLGMGISNKDFDKLN